MSSKEKLVLNTVIIFLFSALILGGGYLRPIPAIASTAIETHVSGETKPHVDEPHRKKEGRGVEGHGEETAHKAEGYGEESWWRFPGWQILFAGIASFYFAMVLAWLPLLVAKKGKGEAH